MGSLLGHKAQCRKILCQTAKRGQTITYGDLAKRLGLRHPRQEWSTVLNPIYEEGKKKTPPCDLTLVVVYASGPAKDLCRYFSNPRGGQPPQTTMLDPGNPKQVADYHQELQNVFNTYANQPC